MNAYVMYHTWHETRDSAIECEDENRDHLVKWWRELLAGFLAVALDSLHNPRFPAFDLEVRRRLPGRFETLRYAERLR